MRFVFLDPIGCYISASTIVIKTLITTLVLCSVEIVAFIQTVTIVIVQTFSLLLLRFPIVRLLSLSYNNTPLLISILMASSMLSRAANAFVTPLPIHPIPIEQIESMGLIYPLTNLSTDSRVTSPSVRQTVDVAIGLLTGMMSAKEYTKMLDPLQYDPYLLQEVLFPASIPPLSCKQRWNDLSFKGKEPGEVQ